MKGFESDNDGKCQEVKSMAQQSLKENVEWKAGTKCDLYDRNTFKWVEAEVIGSFTKDNREWIKVRYGQSDRNVLKGDPDLRKQDLFSGRELKQLRDAAVQIPVIAPILQKVFPSSSGPRTYAHADGLLFILIYIDVNIDR